ncbi:hypothetical protein AMECASPLE_039044 [Ameca splendens]|uniref:Uncharacterized protein n=1 Tax=Ameca splendens TaxID=208324 RepID=A0ABV1AHD1_9TELE
MKQTFISQKQTDKMDKHWPHKVSLPCKYSILEWNHFVSLNGQKLFVDSPFLVSISGTQTSSIKLLFKLVKASLWLKYISFPCLQAGSSFSSDVSVILSLHKHTFTHSGQPGGTAPFPGLNESLFRYLSDIKVYSPQSYSVS